MTSQIASLTKESLRFRVNDSEGIREIPRPQFDSNTVSSNILEVSVSLGSKKWCLEVQFLGRSEAWEAISGFS
jgi:hypothetical protein